MELCLVWSGNRLLIGEKNPKQEFKEIRKISLLKAGEIKSAIVSTPYGVQDVTQVVSIIPMSSKCVDMDIAYDSLLTIEESNEVAKMYLEFRGKDAGLIMPNI